MRKIFLFVLLLPAIAALGHDVYIFTEHPEKGFLLSDVGALWDKYHKESHDRWKGTIQEFGETIDDLALQTAEIGDHTAYIEGFEQKDTTDRQTIAAPAREENPAQKNTNALRDYVGFLLEQKAVFVFGGFALVIYILSALIGFLSGKKDEGDVSSLKKRQNKLKKRDT